MAGEDNPEKSPYQQRKNELDRQISALNKPIIDKHKKVHSYAHVLIVGLGSGQNASTEALRAAAERVPNLVAIARIFFQLAQLEFQRRSILAAEEAKKALCLLTAALAVDPEDASAKAEQDMITKWLKQNGFRAVV